MGPTISENGDEQTARGFRPVAGVIVVVVVVVVVADHFLN